MPDTEPTAGGRPRRGRAWRVAAVAALALLPALGGLPQRARSAAAPTLAELDGARVIVKYKALGTLMRRSGGSGPQHASAMARRTSLALSDGRIIDRRTQVLRGDGSLGSAALAARLAADDEVEYAVPDERRRIMTAPNDPLYAASASTSPASGQWYLRAPDATRVSAINAEAAWDLTTGSSSIVIADLDTGVRFDHPDLSAKLLAGYDFVTSTTTAADGNGRDSDATDPGDWNAAGGCGFGSSASNSSWHGTQTAGILGAQTGNGIGMASVARDVKVLPVRVLGQCGGLDSDIIAAMLWAGGVSSTPVANPTPARVINLSLGSSGSCSAAYLDAISQLTAAGVVVVVAAGNEEGLAVSSPGNCAGVIAVAGLRHAGTKVGFSSVGPQVAISAPGGNCVNTSGSCLYPILTTTNSGTRSAGTNTYSDGSNYSVGTSFATPMVAGTAALMLAANPSLTPAAVKALLQGSARSFPTSTSDTTLAACHAPNGVTQDECLCTTSTCGAGMLDAGAAVAAAAAAVQPVASIAASATTVQAGTTVSLDGSGSSVGSGRRIAGWAWAITSGSAIAAFSGATDAATATLVTSGSGSVTVQLTVTDSSGLSATATSTITVNAVAAPTVQLLPSATVVAAGSTVSFDGSGSTVASGLSISRYAWTITSGSALASLSGASDQATATVATAGSGSGSFTVQLTVTDSLGQSASAQQTVSVTAVTPTASIAASALTATAGDSLSFDGSGSSATSGRTIAGYAWSITSGSGIAAIEGSASDASVAVRTSGAGSFTLQLTVTDSAGATDSRSTSVTVQAAGTASASGASGSGSGGGAFGAGGLLALAAAAALLKPRRRPQDGRQAGARLEG